MKNDLKKVKFVQMRSLGATYSEISEKLEISKPTLIKWSKESECELRNELEMQKERIRKEHGLTYEKVISLKAKIIEKLSEGVLSNDLSKLPVDKAVDILVKLLDEIPENSEFSEKGFAESLLTNIKWNG